MMSRTRLRWIATLGALSLPAVAWAATALATGADCCCWWCPF